MVQWLDDLEDHYQGLRGDIAELRHESDRKFATLETKIDALSAALDVKLARMSEQTAKQIGDTIKWMVAVWLGSFTAIVAVLALVFRAAR